MSFKAKSLVLVVLLTVLNFVSTSSVSAQVTVNTVEDPKAMGYPDGRKIVRDASGNLYLAYRKKIGSAYQVYVSKSTNGGASWTVANGGNSISNISGACNQRVPSIAVDSASVLHVVWYGLDSNCSNSASNERQVKYSRSFDGGASWTAAQNIAFVSGYGDTYVYNGTTYAQDYWQEHPVIYIDGNDKIYVVWEGRDAAHERIGQVKFIKSTNGGSNWTSWINVKETTSSQSRPTIVVDSNDKIFVFSYSKLPGTSQINIIYATSVDGGAAFSSWAAVSATNTYDQRHASAAIDTGNKIHLVWRQRDAASGAKTVVKYSKFTSPSWSAPVTVAAASGKNQYFPSIANAYGSQFIVWTETADDAAYPSEEPTTGKIVLAKKAQGTSIWVKSDVTADGFNTWGSIRWSFNRINGGTVDVVYSSGSAAPYSVIYRSLGSWQ